MFKGNLNVGHGGTYRQSGGGWFGEVAVAWLDYQLKGKAEAASWFVGADCRLCTDPLVGRREERHAVTGAAAVAWLKWQLMGDTSATGKGYFAGPNCRICADSKWQTTSRSLP